MVPTLVENSKFFVYLFVNVFIMNGEPTHTASEMAPCDLFIEELSVESSSINKSPCREISWKQVTL